jgi:ABC-type uncharacterized transport system substrate-binding protein
VDVIVTWGPPLSLAAKAGGTAYSAGLPHCLRSGRSWSRVEHFSSGRQCDRITGHANFEIFAKRLQLLKEVIPSLRRVGVLFSTEQTRSARDKEALNAAAKAWGHRAR